MTKLEQAARQALGALEVATTPLAKDRQEVLRAITTLREALSGVQALSAAPAGFVPVAAFDRLHAHAESLAARLLAASPTPTAEQQAAPKAAPGVGNSGFDHKTAADFLNGKTVSDEAVRTFVAASRWAHDERAALSATLLAMHGVLTSREAEIALLKKALLEAEAAPQQEVQEPALFVSSKQLAALTDPDDPEGEHGRYLPARKTSQGLFTQPLYTTPQPAPAPLSEREAFEAWIEKDGGDLGTFGTPPNMHYRNSSVNNAWVAWKARAALAAQGGKDA